MLGYEFLFFPQLWLNNVCREKPISHFGIEISQETHFNLANNKISFNIISVNNKLYLYIIICDKSRGCTCIILKTIMRQKTNLLIVLVLQTFLYGFYGLFQFFGLFYCMVFSPDVLFLHFKQFGNKMFHCRNMYSGHIPRDSKQFKFFLLLCGHT